MPSSKILYSKLECRCFNPSCKGTPKIFYYPSTYSWSVKCSKCSVETERFSNIEKAIMEWNNKVYANY